MKNKKVKIIVASLILIIVAIPSAVYKYSYNSYKTDLKNAESLLSDELYDDSVEAFINLKSSKFSNKDSDYINLNVKLALELKESKDAFEDAVNLLDEKKYIEAIDNFKNVKESDEKRYNQAQEKLKEASNLYVTDNITKAKTEANNEEYDNAIAFLETILKFDSNNEEAIKLKDTYNLEIQRIKEEAMKKQAEEDAKKEINQPTNTSNSSSSNVTDGASASENDLGYTVKFNGEGWFAVRLNSGVPTPEGFGIRSISYSLQPNGIYYWFVGNDVQYEITFHLPTGDIKESGNSTNNGFIFASLADVPKNQSINVDISATYKGKTYTDSFSTVINSMY